MKKKKKKPELGIKERLPLIPANKVADHGKIKAKRRREVKKETGRRIEEAMQ